MVVTSHLYQLEARHSLADLQSYSFLPWGEEGIEVEVDGL